MKSETESVSTSGLESKAIEEQLERILTHQLFKSSPRCQYLLRYIIEHSLRGNPEPLKERILGIEVFARRADYDTSTDHVVRAAAAEVRKKLAQYYQEPGHEAELRIQIRTGSYTPEFKQPAEMLVQAPPEPPEELPVDVSAAPQPVPRKRRAALIGAAAVVCLLAVLLLFVSQWIHRKSSTGVQAPPQTQVERFWGPLLQAQGKIVICVAAPQTTAAGVGSQFALEHTFALAHLTGFLGQQNRDFDLRASDFTSSADLDQGPSILIGEFGEKKSWVLNSIERRRFYFGGTPGKGLVWIEDRKDPAAREWVVDNALPASSQKQDYVIVDRLADTGGGRPGLAVAGLSELGTIGGLNCLMDAKCVNMILTNAPKDWASMNIEAVLAVKTLNGNLAPQELVAADFAPPKVTISPK
jgi:hypothetical protein